VGKSDLGARLLSTDNPVEAKDIAQQLDALNAERREIEAAVLEQAIALAEAQAADNPHLIFVAREGWHPGVIGIVASRLKDRFERPACVVALDQGAGKGSGRSVSGLHLGNAVIAAREAGIITKGGGHAMAAGFEVDAARVEDLRVFLSARLKDNLGGLSLTPLLDVDGALQPRAANAEFAAQIERLAPFGSGNAEPRFVLPNARIGFAEIVGGAHIRCFVEGSDGARIKGIAFRAAENELGRALLSARGAVLHLAGHLRRDTWQGRNESQMVIEDAARPTS
jgi:single-stranded-DNA-specific exonuclease